MGERQPSPLEGGVGSLPYLGLSKRGVLITTETGQVLGGEDVWGVRIDWDAFKHQPAQIRGTEAESQQIVAQRLLSCLQYHVP